MRTTTWMLAALAALAPSAAWTAPPVISAEADAAFATPAAWSRWQGRLSLGSSAGIWQVGLPSALPTDTRRSASLMGDYYFGRSLSGEGGGGFRVTSGLIFGPRGLLATGQPSLTAGDSVSFGSALPRPAMVSASGEAAGDFSRLPYLGLGYTGLSSHRGWSFSADVGWVGGSAGNTVRLGRSYGQSLDDQVRELRSTSPVPLLQVGMNYAF